MIVVDDATPFSELAKVDRLSLLRDVFISVIIPQEVYRELVAGTHPAAQSVPLADWIEVRRLRGRIRLQTLRAATGLDIGECSAILLAEQIGADLLLLDERAARRVAEARGLAIIGTVGTLLLAKRRGLISDVKEILDALTACGTRIGRQLYREALTEAGEATELPPGEEP